VPLGIRLRLTKRIVYEVSLDRFHRMVWGLVYSPNPDAGNGNPSSSIAMFVGPDGYAQRRAIAARSM